jgi:metallo-beta-lactamase family protein
MRITFHGAAHTVTGSQHLVEVNNKRILLDCGLYQGKRSEARERNRNLPFDPKSIDVLVLSHAHIDHSGNIPNLVKGGFSGDIVCTAATRDLCVSMLQDSGHIQEKDAEFINRKLKKKGEPEVEPIYTQEDALQSLNFFVTVPYDHPRAILPDVELTLVDAGHMLGSASVCLQIHDRDAGRDVRLVFSGDIGQKGLPIIRDPHTIDHADILIMESTYGDRLHPDFNEVDRQLIDIVTRTAQRGGALIIPSFAVGRTQQLVYSFQKLIAAKQIPEIPIFVDSPLATDVTSTFRNHPEVFDDEIREYMTHYGDDDPFGFSLLRYTRKVEESKELNTREGSFAVISASGMAEAGRILHHLRNRIGDSRNTILFTGWQAPNTLGRRILDGVEVVRIFGEEHTVRAEVTKLNGLSGHADANGLVEWASAIRKKPQQTFLVHGEPEPAKALASRLEKEVGLSKVTVPALHESATI